jgi:hypothetical protein
MAVTYFTVVCHGVSELADPKRVTVLKWAVREILSEDDERPSSQRLSHLSTCLGKTEINGFTNYNILRVFMFSQRCSRGIHSSRISLVVTG